MPPDPHHEWSDARLGDRFELIRDTLDSLRALPQEMAELKTRVEGHDEDLDEARAERRELREALRDEAAAREAGRRTITVALIGVGGTITAALISAAVVLFVHFS